MYISRVFGNDNWSCDQSKPCKTIWRAATLASRGDHIHIDGTNTDKDPYTCQSGKSRYPGLNINKSVSLIGSASPMPQIRCSQGTGLMFKGSDNAEQMNVTLSGLLVNESFVGVQDSFVNIHGCKFEGSKEGVAIVIRTKKVLSIHITNSTFSKNNECISVAINSTKSPTTKTQVMFNMTNCSFDGNVLSDGGSCISFTGSSYIDQSVSCNIILKNVTFSRNMFSSKGLVYLDIDNGSQHINFQNLSFINNSPSPGQDVLPSDSVSECIFHSTDVDVFINSSNFTSENARSFKVNATNMAFQIHNSHFCAQRIKGNGAVVSLKGIYLRKVLVSNSSFVNTTATQGGAMNIECANEGSFSFRGNLFTGTMARDGGGAIYFYSPGLISKDAKYSTDDKAKIDDRIDDEQLLKIDITKCNFTNTSSSLDAGGAVHIRALKASVQLRYSTFINCSIGTEQGAGGGGVFIQTTSSLPKRESSSANTDLLLIVESSNFTGCKAFNGGSLYVSYTHGTEMQITVNNSNFISNSVDNSGGALCVAEIFQTENEDWKINNSQITIKWSTFKNNRAYNEGGALILEFYKKGILIFEHCVMESNIGLFRGSVASINNCNVKIRKTQFLNNHAVDCAAVLDMRDVHDLEVVDSLFDNNSVSLESGQKLQTQSRSSLLSIQKLKSVNDVFGNCSGSAIYQFISKGNFTLTINRSRFTKNQARGGGGALSFFLATDIQTDAGCIKEPSAKRYPSWGYKSYLVIENTVFDRNGASLGGAVYLINGKATFQNCSFIDNFATIQGGHIYTGDGSTSLVIQDSSFNQTMEKLLLPSPYNIYSEASFVHAESSGALKLYNTTMDSTPYGITSPLLLVRNGRLIDLGNNNLTTTLNCPVGSQIEILNFTNQFTTEEYDQPCKIEVTILEFSCSACAANSYSLQRGRALGSQVAPGFQCFPCPFGANCSQNILAKPNFWGFKEQFNPPKLKFTMCPLGYCSPPHKPDFPEYNGCQGNRFGELCGQCNEFYTETLYSTNCSPSHKCNDFWFWPVALVYVSLMALYFTLRPPFIPWIKRQILWFKKRETADANEEINFDRGYLKIVFYFYQAANLLLVSNSSQHIFKTKFIEIFLGLFNFQQNFSSSGLICPFLGLTAVTKEIFSASHVFGTFLMICIFYCLHWVVRKCRGRGAPSVGPYIGGILQTMLLGYTTLASVSFNLLRCVPTGSEKRLFYDGNVVCYQWWQYILIAFIFSFFIPFVFVLFWGSLKLYSESISEEKFLLACCFPLVALLYWAFVSLFCTAKNETNEESPSSHMSRNSVAFVLYDSFQRPEEGKKLSLKWESVMIGRRLILIALKAFVSDPMPRLLIMSFSCVLFFLLSLRNSTVS